MDTRPGVLRSPGWAAGAFAAVGLAMLSARTAPV